MREKLLATIEEEITEIIKRLAKRYNLNVEEASNYIKKRRGRPKKKEEKKKGPRGRPPKEEKVERSYVGEELIVRLIEAARKKAEM